MHPAADKAKTVDIFLISQQKHMLWVHIRSASPTRRFWWYPQHNYLRFCGEIRKVLMGYHVISAAVNMLAASIAWQYFVSEERITLYHRHIIAGFFDIYGPCPGKTGLRAYAKTQISLRIRTIWSGPSLSTNRIIWHYRMYQRRTNAWIRLCACAVWIWICVFRSCTFEDTFLLDAVHI